MSAEIQNGAAGVLFGGNVNPPPFGTLAVSIAAPVGRRSFSRFVQAVLRRLRKLVHRTPAAPGCVLCAADFSDVARLARLVAILPVGRKITVPAISAILNERFNTISSDLHLLVYQLRLPIKRTHQGFLLTAPVHLCKNCTSLGERLRQTKPKRLDQLRDQYQNPD
jgi:hypothetical protein